MHTALLLPYFIIWDLTIIADLKHEAGLLKPISFTLLYRERQDWNASGYSFLKMPNIPFSIYFWIKEEFKTNQDILLSEEVILCVARGGGLNKWLKMVFIVLSGFGGSFEARICL